jgi:hypothetical protein
MYTYAYRSPRRADLRADWPATQPQRVERAHGGLFPFTEELLFPLRKGLVSFTRPFLFGLGTSRAPPMCALVESPGGHRGDHLSDATCLTPPVEDLLSDAVWLRPLVYRHLSDTTCLALLVGRARARTCVLDILCGQRR